MKIIKSNSFQRIQPEIDKHLIFVLSLLILIWNNLSFLKFYLEYFLTYFTCTILGNLL